MATLAIWEEETPGAVMTKCALWGDIVDVITYAISCDCRLRGVGAARGVTSPSPIDLRCRPYNTGHTIPCDRCRDKIRYGTVPVLVENLDFSCPTST